MISYIKSPGDGFGSTAQGVRFSYFEDYDNLIDVTDFGISNTLFYINPGSTSSYSISIKYRTNSFYFSVQKSEQYNNWNNLSLSGSKNMSNAISLTQSPFIVNQGEEGGFAVLMHPNNDSSIDVTGNNISWPPAMNMSVLINDSMSLTAGDKVFCLADYINKSGTITSVNYPEVSMIINNSSYYGTSSWNNWFVEWAGSGTGGSGLSTSTISLLNTDSGTSSISLIISDKIGATPTAGNTLNIYTIYKTNNTYPKFRANVVSYDNTSKELSLNQTETHPIGPIGSGYLGRWRFYEDTNWMEIDEFNIIPL